jgi:hypothetical protein
MTMINLFKANSWLEYALKDGLESKDFVKNSSVYQYYCAERDEILKHKWIESEKAGEDIGFERALLDWIQKHRDGWRQMMKKKSH